jgi:hypothetical protein
MATRKTNRKVRQTTKATIPAPLYESEPWPLRIETRLAQIASRVAALEAKWSDLIATIKEEVQAEWTRQKGGQP